MAQFKGTVFISTRIFTERTFGPEAVTRCLSSMAATERAVLESVSAIGWYPVEPILRYHHLLEELFGKAGEYAVCEQAGRFSAEWSMNTVLKFLLRFGSPAWLVSKYGAVWNRYHDSGRWEIVPGEGNRVTGKLHGFQVEDEAFCARLKGWLEGAIRITGGKGAHVAESMCRCRGGAHCQFELSWQ